MMTKESINAAISEAMRFVAKATAAKKELETSGGGQFTAACKRSSLDLTRALAEMRRAQR